MRDQIQRFSAAISDRYRIERELGAGGMATVYLAHDSKHDRKVAVKVLHPDLAATVGLERFQREIKIAAQLHHPHILPLYDSGEADDFLYYVMPYEEGQSLRDKLVRDGELPINEAVQLLRDVVDALAHAHKHGVVHRDIKPENVLLSGRHALVTDFGVARAISQAAGTENLTTAGVALGTPTYMAPEQVTADPAVDQRVDIYAVGIVAYELFAGAPPFTGSSAQEIMAAHLTTEVEPLSRRRPSVSAALEFVVMTCLEKRPADRWQTAEELLSRLEIALTPTTTPSLAVMESYRMVDETFKLTAEVCRKLDRDALDPRIIGDNLHYLDNHVDSDVLVVYHHGMGLDQDEFDDVLRQSPYRGIAPTLYGFEPTARRRLRLSLQDHVTLQQELLAELIRQNTPATVVVVGFSAGADLGFQMLQTPLATSQQIDGYLSLDCNLSLDTCFVSGRIVSMSETDERQLRDLVSFGDTATSMTEWLNLHEYLVKVMRKFRGDVGGLKAFAAGIAGPLESYEEMPFIEWYRVASKRLRALRCVFSDTDAYNRDVASLKLEHLDTGILGEHYDEDSLVTELEADHFELLDHDRMVRHVEAVVNAARA